jgi:hypothetical protein
MSMWSTLRLLAMIAAIFALSVTLPNSWPVCC